MVPGEKCLETPTQAMFHLARCRHGYLFQFIGASQTAKNRYIALLLNLSKYTCKRTKSLYSFKPTNRQTKGHLTPRKISKIMLRWTAQMDILDMCK